MTLNELSKLVQAGIDEGKGDLKVVIRDCNGYVKVDYVGGSGVEDLDEYFMEPLDIEEGGIPVFLIGN